MLQQELNDYSKFPLAIFLPLPSSMHLILQQTDKTNKSGEKIEILPKKIDIIEIDF